MANVPSQNKKQKKEDFFVNIQIGENLRELRKKKNNKQEDLAEFLMISITAVSKWERSECYPDIELLPKIAAYYNISVDDLLGVGEIKKQERINEYCEKSHEFKHAGDCEGNLALWREAQKEFPNNWDVLSSLMYALGYVESEENRNRLEAIKIGERILSECTDNGIRYGAMQVLCFEYNKLGEIEKAKEYAGMAPIYYVTSNQLLNSVLKGDELIEHCQNNIVNLTELLGQEIFLYACRRGGMEGDEKKRAYHTAISVYELIYEKGDFGFYAARLSEIYSELAKTAAKQQNKDETLGYLADAAKYAIIYDTQEDFKHISPLVNRLSHKNDGSTKDYASNNSYLQLEEMKDECYDFCRDDEKFTKLIEDLGKVAVSG